MTIKTGIDGTRASHPKPKNRSNKTEEERKIDIEIGRRIREIRTIDADEDLRTFGRALGVSAQAVHQWERGIGGVSHYKLMKLCKVYAISPEWLLTGVGRKRPSYENRMRLLTDSQKQMFDDVFNAMLGGSKPDDRGGTGE